MLTASISLADQRHDHPLAEEAYDRFEDDPGRGRSHGRRAGTSRLLPSAVAGHAPERPSSSTKGGGKSGACRKCVGHVKRIRALEEELKAVDRRNPGRSKRNV